MRKRTAYTSLLLALTCCSTSHAAKNVEVVRYPSLFMFGGIAQSVGVSYSYSQHQTDNSSSSGSSMRENYNFGTEGAILDPHLLNMQIMGGVSYSQNFDDRTTTLLNGEYSIVASAFDMSHHPFTLASSRSTAVISNGYTPSYSLTNNTYQISGALQNTMLPLQVYYVRATSSTSGLDDNTSGTSSAFGFSLQHYLNRSDTRFSFDHGSAISEGTESSSYSLSLSNALVLDREQRYRLGSSLNVSETDAGDLPQMNFSVNESLSLKLGKALSGAVSESFSYSSSTSFEGEEQTTRTNSVSASLSHMLYQSLGTSISGSYSSGSSYGGDTTSYGGAVRVSYRKVLPAQTLLSMGVDRSLSIQEQHLLDPSIDSRVIVNGVVAEQVIPPPTVSGRVIVVEVSSFVPLETNPELPDPAAPVTVYERLDQGGNDYEVLASGAVRILTGGGIPDGSSLVILYTVEANPDIEVRQDSTAANASLALFGGRYHLSAAYSTSNQDLVSGEATTQGLISSDSLSLMAAANYNPTQVGLQYSRNRSSQEDDSRISAYATHSLGTEKGARMSFSIRDTYSMTESSGPGGRSSNQNTLSLSAGYGRRFFRWLNVNGSLGASDSRGNGRYSDFINVRLVATGAYNQLQFSLAGQTLYRIAGGGNTRDSNVTGSITRFF